MARFSVPYQAVFPYYITARCIDRDWFQMPLERVWVLMGEQLYFVQRAFGIEVIAFVVMQSSFQMILRTPHNNLAKSMRWFMRETARALTSEGKRENQAYAGRYFRSMLSEKHHFFHAYKFVYLSPVHAGLAVHLLDYPYSTLPAVLGLQRLDFAVYDEALLRSTEGILAWLSLMPERKSWESVRKALRRRTFQLGKVGTRPHPLEKVRF